MAQRPAPSCRLGAGRSLGCLSRLPAAPALVRQQRPVASAASASPGGGDAGDASGSSSSAAGQVSVAVTSPAADTGSGAKDPALLARIARAKAYKQASGGSDAAAAAAADATMPQLTEEQQEAMRQQYAAQLRQREQAAASATDAGAYASYLKQLEQEQQQQQQQQGTSSTLDQLAQQDASPPPRPPPARPDFYSNPDAPDALSLLRSSPQRPGSGSADEAAAWLKGVLAEQPGAAAFPSGMRQEEITAAKEAVQRQQGADIITAFPEDYGEPQPQPQAPGAEQRAAAAAADAKPGEDYKPRVTTWGVFPRPSNISEAYGGGRNIRPGQALETAEQRATREAEYAAALQRYKAATFVDKLSDEELRAAQAAFDGGMELFKRGALQQALARFDEVREKVPLKSKLGGLSTLQAAVCYDTLGNSRTAEALYKRIQGHPTSEVSRKAKQLVFGFQAMSFLKTQDLSYAVKKEDYIKYFRRSADRNRMYVASEEEQAADAEQARQAAVVALGVVLGPVLIMGALLASSR